MGDFSRDDNEWDDGWSRAPHGLWTLDVPNGAKVLLGWLHSHSGAFLSTVTVNQARRALGSSSIQAWFSALEAAGFVDVVRKDNGSAFKIVLKMAPWKALIGRPDRAEIGSVTAPKSDRTEEQGEDQGSSSLRSEEELSEGSSPVTEDAAPPEIAKEFWDWHLADRGKPPVTPYMGLRTISNALTKRGYGRDEILDAMKRTPVMTAKAVSDRIAADRHVAEGTVDTVAIPAELVRAWAKAADWFIRREVGGPQRQQLMAACAIQMRRGYGVGETMIRLAVAIRGGEIGDWTLSDVRNVDRFAGELDDYPDAMERAYRNQAWRAS